MYFINFDLNTDLDFISNIILMCIESLKLTTTTITKQTKIAAKFSFKFVCFYNNNIYKNED